MITVHLILFDIGLNQTSSLLKHNSLRDSLFGLFWPYNFLTGILPGVEEIEQVEKEPDVCEKENESSDDVQLHHATNVQVDEHHTYGEVLPITPYQHCR